MSKVIFEVSVIVIGVKKRCRNVAKHRFEIAQIDFKQLTEEDVEKFTEIARGSVKANMREYPANAVLQFTRVKIGDVMRETQYPDPEHKSFQISLA